MARFVYFLAIICLLVTKPAFAEDKNQPVQSKTPAATNQSPDGSQETKILSKEEILKINDKDLVIGSKNAAIIIFEYMSLSCHHCADFYKNTFKELKDKYIDEGTVALVIRDFPLDISALKASQLVRCSDKEQAHKFIDAIFSTQENWVGKKNYQEVLENIAKLGGMSGEKFLSCIDNKELENQISESRFQAAKSLEVRSTPTFYIVGKDGKDMVKLEGGKKLADFSDIIDKKLAKKEN